MIRSSPEIHQGSNDRRRGKQEKGDFRRGKRGNRKKCKKSGNLVVGSFNRNVPLVVRGKSQKTQGPAHPEGEKPDPAGLERGEEGGEGKFGGMDSVFKELT